MKKYAINPDKARLSALSQLTRYVLELSNNNILNIFYRSETHLDINLIIYLPLLRDDI